MNLDKTRIYCKLPNLIEINCIPNGLFTVDVPIESLSFNLDVSQSCDVCKSVT